MIRQKIFSAIFNGKRKAMILLSKALSDNEIEINRAIYTKKSNILFNNMSFFFKLCHFLGIPVINKDIIQHVVFTEQEERRISICVIKNNYDYIEYLSIMKIIMELEKNSDKEVSHDEEVKRFITTFSS